MFKRSEEALPLKEEFDYPEEPFKPYPDTDEEFISEPKTKKNKAHIHSELAQRKSQAYPGTCCCSFRQSIH
jgi:hypothetical protein